MTSNLLKNIALIMAIIVQDRKSGNQKSYEFLFMMLGVLTFNSICIYGRTLIIIDVSHQVFRHHQSSISLAPSLSPLEDDVNNAMTEKLSVIYCLTFIRSIDLGCKFQHVQPLQLLAALYITKAREQHSNSQSPHDRNISKITYVKFLESNIISQQI